MTVAYHLNNLCFRYGSQTVLDIATLCIESQKVTALIGPNGSGKSTLLSILAFIDRPSSGSLTWFGHSVESSNPVEVRRKVALVPQNPYFLNGSVLYNIELGLKLRGVTRDQRRVIAMTTLQNIESTEKANCAINTLSGGERQRIALARALALDPEILLFDEPFTYLDATAIKITENMMNWFVRDNRRTVVFSTHDQLHGMAFADQVISLINGRTADIPLVNLFQGALNQGLFDTGQIKVRLPSSVEKAGHISVDPNEIVLSGQPLESSMQNCFEGRVVEIAEYKGCIRITVAAKEKFEVMITQQALTDLVLEIGSTVWVNFKSTVVRIL